MGGCAALDGGRSRPGALALLVLALAALLAAVPAAATGARAGHGAAHDTVADHAGEVMYSAQHIDLAVSVMLIGSIAFQMSLFYLVNNSNENIRRYSWEVISSTLSIFTAVLLFMGFSGVIEGVLVATHESGHGCALLVALLRLMLLFLVLHLTIWTIATGGTKASAAEHDIEYLESREQMMKCWGTLFAHMTGFAVISTGHHLQSFEVVAQFPALAFGAVLLCTALLFAIFLASDTIRERQVASGRWPQDAVEKCDEEAEETENDIGGLGISFLIVQAIVFCLTGKLPRSHEAKELEVDYGIGYSVVVLCCSALFAGLTLLMVFLKTRSSFGLALEPGDRPSTYPAPASDASRGRLGMNSRYLRRYVQRWFYIFQCIFASSFAWCLLIVLQWEVVRATGPMLHMDPRSTVERVSLALVTSFSSVAFIFVLDWVERLDATGDVADKCIRSIIKALAILIGFSWEDCFDGGVEVIAHLTSSLGFWPPILMKLALACLVAVVVIPAWRLYILKTVLVNNLEKGKAPDRLKHLQKRRTRRATMKFAGVDVSAMLLHHEVH